MAKHLQRKHSSEKEGALALCHPAKSKQSRQMLEDLRRGFVEKATTTTTLMFWTRVNERWWPTEHVDPDGYLPCNMFWFFKRAELWKHEKLCRKTSEPEVESKQRGRVQTAASSLLPCKGQSSQRCAEIVSRMVFDKVSLQVKNDPLIGEFGDRLLEKYGGDRSKDGHVSQKMRVE